MASPQESPLNGGPSFAPAAEGSIRIKYTGVQSFLAVVYQQHDLLRQHKTENQLLEFSEVSDADFSFLSADSTRPCKSARFHYFPNSQILRVKITVWDHEILISLLRKLVERQLIAMDVDDECMTFGSPMNVLGDWVKEPDLCWSPAISGCQLRCVVEVGTSQSARQLSIDAHGWLEAPRSSVQAIITVSFKYVDLENEPNPITISVWKPVYRISSTTRLSPLTIARTATLDVWNVAGNLTASGFHVVKDEDTQRTVTTGEIPSSLRAVCRSPRFKEK
ncbi:unnamed protein product [Penicillium nalgiovense]|uniref:Uncharacterized protein n=1 Tax=Penicillium nalgiovense TaxID=60175 RepID=A0A9W4N078_PENNA|nr:unnamed protein product [Penicillium nalgiovense]CAG8004930.1 unnamed protein product [Penicillium nalgiovense]CAG8006156.1 unnamed protein product [Penicillium nalgiovense]CAG8060907.1 unnamed protein product [Penicillium nalgiovense]CAG8061262.1 unnamed protein product [Penicillium nalgiovense]